MKKIIRRIVDTLLWVSEVVAILFLIAFVIEGASHVSEMWFGLFLITIVIYIFCWNRNSILGRLLFQKEYRDEYKKELVRRRLTLLQHMLGTEKFIEVQEKDADGILALFDINFDTVITEIEKTMTYEHYKKRVAPIDSSLSATEFFEKEKQRMCKLYIDTILNPLQNQK